MFLKTINRLLNALRNQAGESNPDDLKRKSFTETFQRPALFWKFLSQFGTITLLQKLI